MEKHTFDDFVKFFNDFLWNFEASGPPKMDPKSLQVEKKRYKMDVGKTD